jgi:hypothetical protein
MRIWISPFELLIKFLKLFKHKKTSGIDRKFLFRTVCSGLTV